MPFKNSFQKLHDKISIICSLKYVNWPIITALKSKLQFEFIFCVVTFAWVVQTHKSIYPNTCIFTQRVLIVYTKRKIYRIELPIRQFKICHLLGTFGSLIIYIYIYTTSEKPVNDQSYGCWIVTV